ncbi:G-protein coupled receptor Mth-like [Anoplolepis gracilipes]|uniref:G-protein coupled receptor Mth-like n=1 Tax=Anoplolepis gracilipes TaxID=354296 RepID=UPI003B9EB7F0
MYNKIFKILCCTFLFFASSTEPLRNFTIDNKPDNNSRNELHGNSTEKNDNGTISNRYSLRKNFTMDYENDQDVFRINFRSNGRKDDDLIQNESPVHYVRYEKRNQVPREFQMNFTKVDNKNHSINENNNEDYIVLYETYDNITCIRLCCPLGDRYISFNNCITEGPEYVFSDVYNFWNETNMQTEYKKVDEMFQLIIQDPCPNDNEIEHISLNDDSLMYFKYVFFDNGTLYLPYFDQFVESTSYCLAFSNHAQVDAIICSKTLKQAVEKKVNYFITVITPVIDGMYIFSLFCSIMSMLCALIIFLVYCILPELHNIHSFMLCRYSSMLFVLYIYDLMQRLINLENLAYAICIASGLVRYFSSLASYIWLSVMSFDMWWTFRNFRSLTKKAQQQDKKKFLYSIIAWGIPFIFIIICIIMEIVPSVPKSFRPRFDVDTCWFGHGVPEHLYSYGPKTICTTISISLSIHTALKIISYEKDTAHCLRGSESRCYNENKKWAKLYLKLFIMLFVIMAIEWIIMTTWNFWLIKEATLATIYVTYSLYVFRTITNIGTFMLFVCKKTIMQLLLKHFCQNRRYSLKIFTRRGCYSLEHVHHHIKHNYPMEKYNLWQSEKMDKEFL